MLLIMEQVKHDEPRTSTVLHFLHREERCLNCLPAPADGDAVIVCLSTPGRLCMCMQQIRGAFGVDPLGTETAELSLVRFTLA